MNKVHREIIKALTVNEISASRVKLNAAQVERVYLCKFAPQCNDKRFRCSWVKTIAMALLVSVKTIRDIWNQKTWAHITCKIDVDLSSKPKRLSVDDVLFTWNLLPGEEIEDPFADDQVAMFAPYYSDLVA